MFSTVVAVATLGMVSYASAAPVLYITGRGTTVRTSADNGATFTTFATVTGGQLRGIDATASNVFVNNLNGGADATVRPLLAYNTAGTLLDTATYNNSGAFNEQPVGAFGGYVYVSNGGPNNVQNVSTSFDGTSFGGETLTNSDVGNFQGNNITFATAGAASYQFLTGTSGTNIRRSTLDGDGTVSSVTGITTSGGPADLRDIAFTSSGRLVTIGTTGIFLSAPNQITSTAIALTSAFTFTGTETAATGDLGVNGRDFALIGSDLFAVTDTRVFRYTLDDTNGTLAFVGANLHGFSSTGVQIAAAVPEPTSLAALALGGAAMLRRRRTN
ncbi:MAG TPA: PEP-CTERM sorting domain-containing protein [Tepidisphaeraceae bacterium]